MSATMRGRLYLVCALGLGVVGCDDPVVVGEAPPLDPVAPAPAPTPIEPVVAETASDVTLSFNEDDFVELDVRNRDPFRGFASAFRATAVRGGAVQRRVIMPDTPIEDMHLIAIVSGIARPRAMLQDSSGVGFVVSQNDYIGREEVLQSGGADSMPITLNWQVARVRPGEVVLTRTDPSAPDRPPLTRTILLHDEEEDAGQLTLQ